MDCMLIAPLIDWRGVGSLMDLKASAQECNRI
jgi:hypothetical protein